uniref:EF-hand domain-containing protein n=1 Tax=Pyramimonas obovata TaxID=1411642 RepID=A0A7S0QZZ8_9CHLO|mmetsp:Transcript_2319/g.4691  ORF Transcript_2319/g.4691 Transcript_2319/m.4691 type:complete len:471 (+) Transcript_2319:165-1577(+)|eukprot:CAMPEP_0118932762 /NCGR_PEP_ID=MMETSP1169-20130426/10607_1 /TAXON_ID=36882 /ORGANISM="Pyramimonas obovata, Strain CCMP722" /LENGTH=470 /DNA_ID=CAMNT_0006875461 /DNA_START=167 /DNA_END=1579 /DNA_ORIENTATION=+
MSSRYQKQFTIPEGFPQLLKTFSREVLRCQPPNIYKFGARYFAQLVEARQVEAEEAMREDEASIFDMSMEELQDFCLDLFMQFDADGNGFLDRKEFKAVMKSAKLGLSNKDIRKVMAEADEDGNGNIEYREFLPLMVEIIHTTKAKEAAAANRTAEEDELRDDVEAHLLHGIPREELEAVMKNVFEMADADRNGTLSLNEFRDCLKSSELGLTRKEINLLMSECDTDGDGNISYTEFLPICFNILVERFKDQIQSDRALQSSDQLEQTLMEIFQQFDKEGSGTLTVHHTKKALQFLSQELLGLSRLQILAIMSEANPDPDGSVDYPVFAKTAADMIYTLVDLDSQGERVKAINQIALTEGAELLHGLDVDTVKDIMSQAFVEADKDGNGYLDSREIQDVLRALGTGDLQLQDYEINALIASVDADGDGKVVYNELVDFMYDVLTHLNRERYVQEVAFGAQEQGQDEEEEQ